MTKSTPIKRENPTKKKAASNTEYLKKLQAESEQKKVKVSQYLKQWHTKRASWKFEKISELWLIKNFQKKPMLSEAQFPKFLLYVAEMRGSSRERILKKAEDVISGNAERTTSEESPAEKGIKLKRAEQVINVISVSNK